MLLLCGGNIDTTTFGRCLERGLASEGRLLRFDNFLYWNSNGNELKQSDVFVIVDLM